MNIGLPSIESLRRAAPDRNAREPERLPDIVHFEAETTACVAGEDIHLIWEVIGADRVWITDIGRVPASGRAMVIAEETRAFAIGAANGVGEVERSSDDVTVLERPPIMAEPLDLPTVELEAAFASTIGAAALPTVAVDLADLVPGLSLGPPSSFFATVPSGYLPHEVLT